MTTKRLYNVTIETEIVVLADSRLDAEKMASRIPHTEAHAWDATAKEFSYMPTDWWDNSIPFGDEDPADPDKTIGEWLKDGAAPQYTKILNALKKAKAR